MPWRSNCVDCGAGLGYMATRARGRCLACYSEHRDRRKQLANASDFNEWGTGLEGVESYQLVDELLKRGWTASERTRNYKKRVVLLAPADHHPQSTRKRGSG